MEYTKLFKIKKRDVEIQCTINLPKLVVQHLKLREGDNLELSVNADQVVLKRAKTKK